MCHFHGYVYTVCIFFISIISIHLKLGAIQVAHGNLDPGSLVALGSQEVLVTLVAVAGSHG